MTGLLFLLFNVGVVLVAHWCLQNDSPSLDGATNGLFAMTKRAQGPAPAPTTKKVVPPKMRIPRLRRR
jgi:hypothetical protein